MLDLTPPMTTEELRHLHTRKKDSSSRRQSRKSMKEEEFCRIQDTADGKKERRVEERVTESKLGTIMENTLVPYRGAEEKKVAVAILIHICNLSWDALTSQHLECDVDLDMFANITGEHS